MSNHNILKLIYEDKKIHVARRKEMYPLSVLKEKIKQQGYARPFLGNIQQLVKKKKTVLIAEIKKSSPSQGTIRDDFDPPSLAMAYAEGGAACLSILTDVNYFHGKDEYIEQVKEFCPLPVLRKDFIIDPYQIYESRAIGADAVLLIKSILSLSQVKEFSAIAQKLGMDVLLEVHNETEMEAALQTDITLVGINNRDLKSFEVSLDTTYELAPTLRKKKKIVVCESGIRNNTQIKEIQKKTKTYAFLVGEALMRQPDVETATLNLLRSN